MFGKVVIYSTQNNLNSLKFLSQLATTFSNVRNSQHELRRHFPTVETPSTSCDDTFQRSKLPARAATTLSNVRNPQHELRRRFPTFETLSTSCDDTFQRSKLSARAATRLTLLLIQIVGTSTNHPNSFH